MPFFYFSYNHRGCTKQNMYATAKQEQDGILSLLRAVTFQLLLFWCSELLFTYILDNMLADIYRKKGCFKSVSCLMMPNNRIQHYTRYWQRHIAEYPEASRTYRENYFHENGARQRNVEPSKLHNENDYLECELFWGLARWHFKISNTFNTLYFLLNFNDSNWHEILISF